ncbi:ankyrin repeat-containing domain protein [Aspergillus welwitschiae]|uniref:Ankyrin repeat-containing domain protein n=1 Tax=Aspergillus welwitschiae TaxID=1341132 RepID=A0A3F3QAV6_9EURO|nr:ankyrin repeat-containing domain protein [Aspergillus welwitschiae]RDH35932.1 ankyrin repeat-containing domain protein [Aspergillus welwitschiae]
MSRLDGKVKKVKDNTATSGFVARARSEWEKVKYPLKESTILKLRDLLQEQKLDLVLILIGLNIDTSSVKTETLAQHMSQLSCNISQIRADVGENKNILEASVQDLKHKEILRWLYGQDPFTLYHSRESRRYPGTCQWFLKNQEYLRWRSAGSLLWVKGEVGCGKSFLCSAVIEHLQTYFAAQSDNMLLHFFFSFADAHRPNPLLCLSSLLRQMCLNERVLHIVEELYERFNGYTGSRAPGYHDIELAMDSAIACLEGCKEIYIVFDALDELPNDPDEYQRSHILNWIRATSTRYRHVHILFTSRSNSSSRDVEDFAITIPSIRIVTIDAMSNRHDMFLYLEAQFKESRVLNMVSGHSLSKTLNDMISLSDGMFLWVHLQMVELTKLPTPRLKDIDRILKSMPPRLDDTYIRILQSIHYLLSKEAARALLWLSLSLRPLHLVEVNESCIIVPQNKPAIAEEDRLGGEGILPCLSGLVRRTGIDNNYVALSHFSVKEFLTSEALKRSPCSSYGFRDNLAHAWIAESCVAYINYCYCSENRTGTRKDLEQFPLLEYACRYWFEHMISAGKQEQTELDSLASNLLQSGEKWTYVTLIYNHMIPDIPFSCAHRRWTLRTPLGWAAALGLESVVRLLLSQRQSDLDAIQDIKLKPTKCFQVENACGECTAFRVSYPTRGTALVKAIEFGHTSIARLLIEKGANINLCGEFGGTALSVACRLRNGDLVQYLLDSGASPSDGLMDAVRECSWSICQQLLDAGAAANEQIEGEMPLIVAASMGYNRVCQVLLDFGADVNRLIEVDDPTDATDALTAATMHGKIQIVKLLLSKGAHVRGSALAYSLTGLEDGPFDEHREICNILVQHGNDMNPDLGGSHNTPLAMALSNGWLDIARCMISKGARVEPGDPTCLLAGNILVEAVFSVDMTRTILDIGVAADSPIAAVKPWAWEMDDDACNFTTALQAAAYHGHVDTVKVLLANGANPNIRGPPYGSTLFSLFAGACYAIENVWLKPNGEAEREAYDQSVREKTVRIYEILQERGVQNIIPWGSLDYDAFRMCIRGIKYSSIRTGITAPRPINQRTFAKLSGGTFRRVVRS